MKLKITIPNRPIYAFYLTLKYNFIQLIFGSLNYSEYYDILKIIGQEDNPIYRPENLIEGDDGYKYPRD